MDEVSEASAWVANCHTMWLQKTGASWAVVTSDHDSPVGQVGLRAVSLFEAQAAISYWTVPAARGRGIADQSISRKWLPHDGRRTTRGYGGSAGLASSAISDLGHERHDIVEVAWGFPAWARLVIIARFLLATADRH
jgi:hypothetical protein